LRAVSRKNKSPMNKIRISALSILPLHSLYAVVAASLLMTSGSARAALYTTQSSFTGALQSGSYTENFNAFGENSTHDPLPLSQGGFTYSIQSSAAGGVFVFTPGLYSSGKVASSVNSGNLIVTFASDNVTAVGGNFFRTDSFNADAGAVTVTATWGPSGIGNSTPFTLNNSSTGGTEFGGITVDSGFISSIVISGGSFPSVDNFIVGQVSAVPEPAGYMAASLLALFGLGHFGRGYLRRKTNVQA
jgi:hypothetical protein